MAPSGAMCIIGAELHPTSVLIIWMVAVLVSQYVGYATLFALIVIALSFKKFAWFNWFGYVRRARWLLLALWLILAYNTPGEALLDRSWAPTYEGVAEANLQATRLLTMLAFLAWLFAKLDRNGLIAGLWGGLQPFRIVGLDVERLVVRLSLVLDRLQEKPERAAWRQMLLAAPIAEAGSGVLHVNLEAWRLRDIVVTIAAGIVLIGVVLL